MAENKNIGALWKKQSKQGNSFMSGYVEIEGKKHNITVFNNKFKKAANAPDYTILPAIQYTDGKHKFAPSCTDNGTDHDNINGEYGEQPY